MVRICLAGAIALSLADGGTDINAPLRPGRAAREDADGPWWSFRPVARPPVPAAGGSWARTPADAFVLEKLRSSGLEPSGEADRRTLLRRLTFDLHGLPPSIEEVEEFLADPSPDAYERLADRLLASPRLGERWGRHWLDVVHYGETHGYDKDKRRPHAWPYRDYVIRAFNEDVPYGCFVEEQLAGDALYPDDPDGVPALGFIAAGPWDFVGHVELREGTVDKAITRSNDRDDMVATAMSTFASVTAHCARCHEHKFDPISQEDYYRLQAVFAGVERADRPYDPDRETHRARRALTAEAAPLEARLGELEGIARSVTSTEVAELDGKIAGLSRRLESLPGGPPGKKSETMGFHSQILPGPGAARWVQVDLGRSVPVDHVVLFPAHVAYGGHPGPGFGFPPRFRVELSGDPELRGGARTIADHTAADFPNPGDAPVVLKGGGVAARFVRVTATRLWKRTDDYIFALAELAVVSGSENAALRAEVTALDSIEAPPGWARRNLTDGFTSLAEVGGPEGSPSNGLRSAVLAKRIEAQAEIDALRTRREAAVEALLDPAVRAERREAASRLEELQRKLAALPPPRLVYAGASDFTPSGSFTPPRGPRPIHILHRGDVSSPGQEVGPGALSCLPGLEGRFALEDARGEGEGEGARRSALARWLTDPRNPLTWRSIANRLWHHHFGRGIVDTPNDFGRMGSRPTHPELLDWLASRLLERGGSLKELHRLLVTSAAYRQSSAHDEARAKVDAENRLLWRASRARLEAEVVRDALLAASGLLDLAMGGPSVDHFLFQDDHSPRYDYAGFEPDHAANFRRSVYRSIVRSVPDPFMDCMDCADPSILTPRRNVTLTALQALAMLNAPFTVRQAERFAERLRRERPGPDLRGQIELAFLHALARPPSAMELDLLAAYGRDHGLENACRLVLSSNELHFVD
ncbi:MAG: DUF1553 domain-containing protein [Planctomycetes bacterium]|nr:DUF1553 domain-containing protein [Planctomycetota bacterium]